VSDDRPNKPVSNWDRGQLLERAILDHELEPFKSEIDRKLARFNSQKKELLSFVFDDYDQRRPSDRHDEAWLRIENIAHQYIAREILKQTVKSNAERVDRYRAIADAAQNAMNEIKELEYDDLGSPLLKAWLDGTMGLNDAIEGHKGQLDKAVKLGSKVDEALKALCELKAAANAAADELHEGPGRRDGTSILPGNYISALKEIYQEGSGQHDKGRSSEFVEKFLVTIGKEDKTKNYSATDAARYQRKKARKKAR
jgi:hypothetical protein